MYRVMERKGNPWKINKQTYIVESRQNGLVFFDILFENKQREEKLTVQSLKSKIIGYKLTFSEGEGGVNKFKKEG